MIDHFIYITDKNIYINYIIYPRGFQDGPGATGVNQLYVNKYGKLVMNY